MFPLRLKTKLVLAITAMVSLLVLTTCAIYISQLVKQRIDETYQNGQFVASEVFQSAREALETDFASEKRDLSDPAVFRDSMDRSLQNDSGLNSLLQSVVGYSPTIYDVAIVDNSGRSSVHSDPQSIGKVVNAREDFGNIHSGGFWKQVRMVYGQPTVYDLRLALLRDGQPFATVRVGISSVFLKSELQPKLNSAIFLAFFAILFSVILSAVVSTLAFAPLEKISRRLDEMTASSVVPASPPSVSSPKDEYGVVNTKIEVLGQQMRDVKEVFSALQENLDQIMTNLQDGVMLFTREERAVLVSSSIERFLGRSRSDLLGKSPAEIFSGYSRLGEVIATSFANRRPVQQLEIPTAGINGAGPVSRLQLSIDFIEENGESIGTLLTLRDAESVHKIEDELEISRRLAAVGRLTSGVAHEVKNPINAIVVHLEVLRQKLKDPDPDAKRHIDVISTEIRRLDRVVQTLVDFTRPMELRLAEVDLRRLLDDVISLSTPDAEKHGVHILADLPSYPLLVKVDVDLVKQAVLNIMINGMQAMAGNPDAHLRVAASRVHDEAMVEIEDEGGGIPENIREKIFNLYFTTKKGGSGIGLPMSYRVMQLHNGALKFDSVQGKSTTFRLTFPLTEAGREVGTQPVAISTSGQTTAAH